VSSLSDRKLHVGSVGLDPSQSSAATGFTDHGKHDSYIGTNRCRRRQFADQLASLTSNLAAIALPFLDAGFRASLAVCRERFADGDLFFELPLLVAADIPPTPLCWSHDCSLACFGFPFPRHMSVASNKLSTLNCGKMLRKFSGQFIDWNHLPKFPSSRSDACHSTTGTFRSGSLDWKSYRMLRRAGENAGLR